MYSFDSDFVVFFFFKQKTAYEMRISDWSSDVCSSDLALHEQQHGVVGDQLGDAVVSGGVGHCRFPGRRAIAPAKYLPPMKGWRSSIARHEVLRPFVPPGLHKPPFAARRGRNSPLPNSSH